MSAFQQFLQTRYNSLKAQRPNEPRRRLKLRAAEEFWRLASSERAHFIQAAVSDSPTSFPTESDPFDLQELQNSDVVSLKGIVVRTDFTDDSAWTAFCSTVLDAERLLLKDLLPVQPEEDGGEETDSGDENDAQDDGPDKMETEENRSSSQRNTSSIFYFVDPRLEIRPRFLNASNLTLLRLLCDIDIVNCPPRAQDVPRVRPPHPLVDFEGLHEVYVAGPLVWVYDARSRIDSTVRVVNSLASSYGTATGDSWRAKGTFIPELHLNLDAGTMKVDFGGLDGWDANERGRNLAEASHYAF